MKIMIVGAGTLGSKLANTLISSKVDVTVLDTDTIVLSKINENLDVLTVKAHGGRLSELKNLHIKTYDLLIAVTGNDDTNILICNIAKRLGCNRVIARIRNPEYEDQLDYFRKEMNIDYIVNPELALSNEISRYLIDNYAFYSGEFADGKISVLDINLSNLPSFVGKKLMNLQNMRNLIIVAVLRGNKTIVPHGDTILEENDKIFVIGKKESISALAGKRKNAVTRKYLKKAMILGGGKTGYYVAEKLTKFGIIVKLIESNRDRCDYLSECLNNTLIIHGNGSDIDLLEEEELESMDAFIAVTGNDEENLLMSLRAKQLRVNKVIAKLRQQNYIHIVEKLGVDVALNSVDIVTSEIVKYIRGRNVVSVSHLLDGQSEVTEIIVKPELPFVGKSLAQIKLPKGIIVGAVLHKNEVIIPKGDTLIHGNDRLVVFCVISEVPALEKFFDLRT